MWSKFISRKLIAGVLGTLVSTWLAKIGMSAEVIASIVALIMTYIGGQAVVDAVVAFKALPGAPAAAGAPAGQPTLSAVVSKVKK